jgi:BirA family biotin operon repressor/biotin-[acetyl-CoA-carboxylase] ligase
VLEGAPCAGWVVRAAVQTAGRGQRARDWQAGAGGSYQTLIVREPDALIPATALVMALGLAEVFPVYGVRAGIKWPNDLYYRGKKLAGVLVERVAGHLLIGVGVNVNNEVPPRAVGLRGWDVTGVHMVVLEGLGRALGHLEDASFDLSEAYRPFDLLRGERLVLEVAGTQHEGLGLGIDAAGRLLLEVDGVARAFSSGRLRAFGLSGHAPR